MDAKENKHSGLFIDALTDLPPVCLNLMRISEHATATGGNPNAAQIVLAVVRSRHSGANFKALNPKKIAPRLSKVKKMKKIKKPFGLMNLLSHRPSQESLKQKGILRSRQVFNITFTELKSNGQLDSKGIPRVVQELIGQLRKRDARHVEGLFRISGNRTEILNTKTEMDYGKSSNYDLDKLSVHTCSGLLKLFIRELAEPLLGFDNYPLLVRLYRAKDYKAISTVFTSLPTPQLNTFTFLLDFLVEVNGQEATNLMKANNLAIVWAPNLLRMRVEKLLEIQRDTPFTIGVLEYALVSHRHKKGIVVASDYIKSSLYCSLYGEPTDQKSKARGSNHKAVKIDHRRSISISSSGRLEGEPRSSQAVGMPKDWYAVLDKRTQRVYYVNVRSQERSWEPPEGAKPTHVLDTTTGCFTPITNPDQLFGPVSHEPSVNQSLRKPEPTLNLNLATGSDEKYSSSGLLIDQADVAPPSLNPTGTVTTFTVFEDTEDELDSLDSHTENTQLHSIALRPKPVVHSPAGGEVLLTSSALDPVILWEKLYHPASERNYYHSPSTGETVWQLPHSVDPSCVIQRGKSSLKPGHYQVSAEGEWKGHSAGGCFPNYETWRNNDQYRLTVAPPNLISSCLITLEWLFEGPPPAPPPGKTKPRHPAFGIYVFKNEGPTQQLIRVGPESVVAQSAFKAAGMVMCALELDLYEPSLLDFLSRDVKSRVGMDFPTHYTIVPSTFEPNQPGRFRLSVHASHDVTLQKLTQPEIWKHLSLKNEWKGLTAGGCRNNVTWANNPKFIIESKVAQVMVVIVRQEDESTQVDDQGQDKLEEAIGCYIVDKDGTIIAKAAFAVAQEVVCQIEYYPSQGPFTVIPSTFASGIELAFSINVSAPAAFQLTQHVI